MEKEGRRETYDFGARPAVVRIKNEIRACSSTTSWGAGRALEGLELITYISKHRGG